MNARLTLTELRDRLHAQLNAGAVVTNPVYCGTGRDRDYVAQFTAQLPAAWVLAQRLTPIDDGRGYSGVFRQHCRVDFAVRVVVQRYADGVMQTELALNDLHNRVAAALLGWTPTGADYPLAFAMSQDGEETDSLATMDLVFQTQTTYLRASQ